MKTITYTLADHVCQCGGRVLQQRTSVVTAGGNPFFRCAQCGIEGSGFNPPFCWCNHSIRGQNRRTYICLPKSKLINIPKLDQAFRNFGFDPQRNDWEVGVVTIADYNQYSKP